MTILESAAPPDDIDWDDGRWLNRPPAVERDHSQLVVHAGRGSQFWRRDDLDDRGGHALLRPLTDGEAMDVSFTLDFLHEYDQAGILLHASPQEWLKAGAEICDRTPHVGAVVTRGLSDWSMSPVPAWRDAEVTVRVELIAGEVIVRAKSSCAPWRLIRVAPWTARRAEAGPYCASPDRHDLAVRFTRWRMAVASGAACRAMSPRV